MTTETTDVATHPPTRILLIRHGQSVANAGGIPPDHITNPLTELGHAQAKAFADGFSCEPTLFLISPYLRAQQTSVPLRQRYPGVPIEEWPIQEFHYLNPAKHNGTSEEQQMPHILGFWERDDPSYSDGAGAESFSDFVSRARNVIKRLAQLKSKGCIAVFTHGFFMQAIRILLLFPNATDQQLMSNFRRFHFVNFIENLDAVELEVVNNQLRMIGQQHLTAFTLQGETSHA
ncbi:histidine phosphatase family protein [Tunturiibacter gelidoferens]|uniref:Broad specificity phosphatase PhoE n=1 Tax=Tunturiibacter lichenicola TaxID=2051959 RepID=A0A7Y9T439_9BACT|nr:histidine phosphatase family protein [Edaphobacter lichenicola]NYF53051.1 broad specificity phosphatase PhoE [Edaphobacter lichenicola]